MICNWRLKGLLQDGVSSPMELNRPGRSLDPCPMTTTRKTHCHVSERTTAPATQRRAQITDAAWGVSLSCGRCP